MSRLAIIVDWGTSRFRAWLVEVESGATLDEITDGKGLRDLATPEFPDYCRGRLAPWRDRPEPVPIYMAGMVGAAQGWQAAPQLPLPVQTDDLAAHAVPAAGVTDAWIIPGCRYTDQHGVADLMRGEEVQIFGALALTERGDADLCLPGTHSKWARVHDGALIAFSTAMTGEVYEALMDHTLLGTPAERDAAFAAPAFRKGMQQAARDGGLLHHLFTARSRYVQGDLAAGEIASYLSGLLIGHELTDTAGRYQGDVLLVCSPALKTPYETALQVLGVTHTWVASSEASIAGMREIILRRQDSP